MTVTVGPTSPAPAAPFRRGRDRRLLLDPRRAGGRTRRLRPLPASLKVVLENMLRFEDGRTVTVDDIRAFGDGARNGGKSTREIAYRPPARVLMQDFTGVPRWSTSPRCATASWALAVTPQDQPAGSVDLVIDHSVMIDEFGTPAPSRRTSTANTNATWNATCS